MRANNENLIEVYFSRILFSCVSKNVLFSVETPPEHPAHVTTKHTPSRTPPPSRVAHQTAAASSTGGSAPSSASGEFCGREGERERRGNRSGAGESKKER